MRLISPRANLTNQGVPTNGFPAATSDTSAQWANIWAELILPHSGVVSSVKDSRRRRKES
jgi:hypothetical protein